MASGIEFGVSFTLLGFYVLRNGLRLRRQLGVARNWPTTMGTVTHSEAVRKPNGIWISYVQYAFYADGSDHTGTTIGLAGELSLGFTDRIARAKVARYPVGTTVLVHFDPDDPQQSFLEASPVPVNLRLGVGTVLLVGGLALDLVYALS